MNTQVIWQFLFAIVAVGRASEDFSVESSSEDQHHYSSPSVALQHHVPLMAHHSIILQRNSLPSVFPSLRTYHHDQESSHKPAVRHFHYSTNVHDSSNEHGDSSETLVSLGHARSSHISTSHSNRNPLLYSSNVRNSWDDSNEQDDVETIGTVFKSVSLPLVRSTHHSGLRSSGNKFNLGHQTITHSQQAQAHHQNFQPLVYAHSGEDNSNEDHISVIPTTYHSGILPTLKASHQSPHSILQHTIHRSDSTEDVFEDSVESHDDLNIHHVEINPTVLNSNTHTQFRYHQIQPLTYNSVSNAQLVFNEHKHDPVVQLPQQHALQPVSYSINFDSGEEDSLEDDVHFATFGIKTDQIPVNNIGVQTSVLDNQPQIYKAEVSQERQQSHFQPISYSISLGHDVDDSVEDLDDRVHYGFGIKTASESAAPTPESQVSVPAVSPQVYQPEYFHSQSNVEVEPFSYNIKLGQRFEHSHESYEEKFDYGDDVVNVAFGIQTLGEAPIEPVPQKSDFHIEKPNIEPQAYHSEPPSIPIQAFKPAFQPFSYSFRVGQQLTHSQESQEDSHEIDVNHVVVLTKDDSYAPIESTLYNAEVKTEVLPEQPIRQIDHPKISNPITYSFRVGQELDDSIELNYDDTFVGLKVVEPQVSNLRTSHFVLPIAYSNEPKIEIAHNQQPAVDRSVIHSFYSDSAEQDSGEIHFQNVVTSENIRTLPQILHKPIVRQSIAQSIHYSHSDEEDFDNSREVYDKTPAIQTAYQAGHQEDQILHSYQPVQLAFQSQRIQPVQSVAAVEHLLDDSDEIHGEVDDDSDLIHTYHSAAQVKPVSYNSHSIFRLATLPTVSYSVGTRHQIGDSDEAYVSGRNDNDDDYLEGFALKTHTHQLTPTTYNSESQVGTDHIIHSVHKPKIHAQTQTFVQPQYYSSSEDDGYDENDDDHSSNFRVRSHSVSFKPATYSSHHYSVHTHDADDDDDNDDESYAYGFQGRSHSSQVSPVTYAAHNYNVHDSDDDEDDNNDGRSTFGYRFRSHSAPLRQTTYTTHNYNLHENDDDDDGDESRYFRSLVRASSRPVVKQAYSAHSHGFVVNNDNDDDDDHEFDHDDDKK